VALASPAPGAKTRHLSRSPASIHAGPFVIMRCMNKKNKPDLLMIGFALLLPGIFLATILDSGRIFQIIGLILLIASSAVFGASISARVNRKK